MPKFPSRTTPPRPHPTLTLPTMALAVLLLGPQPGRAADFSFQGALVQPNAVPLFQFSLSAPGTVTLQSLGYAGGLNAAGELVADGGFDTVLALFDAAGMLLEQNDDGAGAAPDPVTGSAYDAVLEVLLGPGRYTVALASYGNFAVGPALSDGFTGNGAFNDIDGNPRGTAWALDVLGADSASLVVPEPAALALFGAGLAGLGLVRRRRRGA